MAVAHSEHSEDSTQRYEHTQRYFARAYGLVCAIAAKEEFNLEDKDGVDVRVLLVSWADKEGTAAPEKALTVSLGRLATSGREWQYAFGVEDETGTAMVKDFVQAKNRQSPSHDSQHAQQIAPTHSDQKFPPCVAVGGTFDHLHIGHKLLLSMTIFAALDQQPNAPTHTAIIGITGDELLKNKKYAEHLESWEVRQQGVLDFIQGIIDFHEPSLAEPVSQPIDKPGPNGRAVNTTLSNGLTIRCVEINDAFGPTIAERDIDTLIISGETRSGGKAVNDKRSEQGWHALRVFEVDVLEASASVKQAAAASGTDDFADKISSTAIRKRLAETSTAKI